MKNKSNRRKRKIVHHVIERKYLWVVLAAMLGPVALVSGCLYYLIWQTLAYELAIPELIYHALIPAFERINLFVGIGIPIIFCGVTALAVRFSHHFAGPIARIETELDHMIETGDFKQNLRVRPKDDLAPLIQKVNQAIQMARESRS